MYPLPPSSAEAHMFVRHSKTYLQNMYIYFLKVSFPGVSTRLRFSLKVVLSNRHRRRITFWVTGSNLRPPKRQEIKLFNSALVPVFATNSNPGFSFEESFMFPPKVLLKKDSSMSIYIDHIVKKKLQEIQLSINLTFMLV